MTDQDHDQDVRDMLRAKAESIRPSADGMQTIEAKLASSPTPARRRPPMVLMAAAALLVVAMVGAVLVLRDDDATQLATEGIPATGGMLDAVWPSNDPEVLRGISAAWVREESPMDAVKLYLLDRVGEAGLTDGDIAIDGDTVTVTGPVDTEITMHRLDGDGPWYVQRSRSPHLEVDVAYDGANVHAEITPAVDGALDVTAHVPEGASTGAGASYDGVADELMEVDLELSTGEPAVVVYTVLRGDGVVGLHDVLVSAPGAGSEAAPRGVWPWPGDAVDDAVFTDPLDTARAYVASRITDLGATTDNGFSAGTVTFTGDVSTTVFLRQDGDRWYVEAAASDLVTMHGESDGSTTARVETGGSLTRTTQTAGDPATSDTDDVEGGEQYRLTPNDDGAVRRELFVLDTIDATTAIAETAIGGTTVDQRSGETESAMGVWPPRGHDVPGDVLADPAKLAARYVAETVGISERTVFSEFRPADGTSGTVEVSGDRTGHIVLRELESRWQVETVYTPHVEAYEMNPGEVRLLVVVDGELSVTVLDEDGATVQSMPDRGMNRGEEVIVVPDAPDGTPITVRWTLVTPDFTSLGHVRLWAGAVSGEHPVPEGALSSEGALDPTQATVTYLDSRLGGRTVAVHEYTATDDTHGEVAWEAGVILLEQVDGYWYVMEAIGDSVQIVSARSAGTDAPGQLDVEIQVAEPGVLHITDTSSMGVVDIRVDDASEGTIVPFRTGNESTWPGPLLVVFETATGFVSLAERVIA